MGLREIENQGIRRFLKVKSFEAIANRLNILHAFKEKLIYCSLYRYYVRISRTGGNLAKTKEIVLISIRGSILGVSKYRPFKIHGSWFLLFFLGHLSKW